jgi:hypothetical protein
MEGNQLHILLSVQGALLDHVSPLLRAVTVDFDKKNSLLILHFFYDGEVTNKLYDLASCACVEADPGVFPYTLNDEITTRLNYPEPIPTKGRIVYLRKEPTPTIYKQKSALLFGEPTTPLPALLLLAMLDSLLGKITPELRQVNIAANQKTKNLAFYFFYDGEISKETFDLANSAIDEAIHSFIDYSINRSILRLDFPEKIPSIGDRVPYARYEG